MQKSAVAGHFLILSKTGWKAASSNARSHDGGCFSSQGCLTLVLSACCFLSVRHLFYLLIFWTRIRFLKLAAASAVSTNFITRVSPAAFTQLHGLLKANRAQRTMGMQGPMATVVPTTSSALLYRGGHNTYSLCLEDLTFENRHVRNNTEALLTVQRRKLDNSVALLLEAIHAGVKFDFSL